MQMAIIARVLWSLANHLLPISWLDNFRRLARNYEQFLHTAQIMAEFACMILLLKHI